MKTRKIAAVLILALVLVWVAGCAINPVTGKKEFMLISESDEIALGAETDQQIVQQYGIYYDQRVEDYVAKLGTELGKLSHRPQLAYQFKVLDTPVINAFAVPGGYVYLTRGILAYLNDEAELAGVMSHELGHVCARHSAKQLSYAQLATVGLGLGVMLSEKFEKYAMVAQFGVSMLFLRFSRDNEREADNLGVEYSSKAGFDANSMADFFGTLERMQPEGSLSGLPEWFSTHPNPDKRIEAVKAKTVEWQQTLKKTSYVRNRESYLPLLEGLVYGDDPRQGYVEGQTFYHPDLKITFPIPQGWQLENMPSQVQMGSPNGDAAMILILQKAASPTEAAQQFVGEANAQVRSSNTLRINGFNALRMVSDINSQTDSVRVQSTFIAKDTYIITFHGFAQRNSFSRFAATFSSVQDQFKPLADASKINVQPRHVQVRTVKNAGLLRDVLSKFGAAADKLEALAIMNGMKLDDRVPAGTSLKMVR